MENQKFCQSCAMPMNRPEDYGTEKDGFKSEDYCQYCYAEGAFSNDATMGEMIEICVPFCKEHYGGEDEARKAMKSFFPTLKRWADS